jgi:hypothetical protein
VWTARHRQQVGRYAMGRAPSPARGPRLALCQ